MPNQLLKKILKNSALTEHILKTKIGLEREELRVDRAGRLATTPHPKTFGSPLKNERITLDFAEAQLELTTPPTPTETSTYEYLNHLQAFVDQRVGKELLWPLSMPPQLPPSDQIALGNFGTSAVAEKKRLYREGLRQRYGAAMQTISGIHFNFSLPPEFWEVYGKLTKIKLSVPAFRDHSYFGLMRNVIRDVPLVTYLFGASPIIHASSGVRSAKLKKFDAESFFGPYATSLRLSEFGYHNARRGLVEVSYNSVNNYLDDLLHAISTPSKLWSTFATHHHGAKQLNGNILQLENEFYTAIRPKQKQHVHPNESIICALACAGVEYVELRTIDLNPFAPTGITLEEMEFLKVFMLTCLLSPSPLFARGEQRKYEENQRLVALEGRRPGLKLYTSRGAENFVGYARRMLDRVQETATFLGVAGGTTHYARIVNAQYAKLDDAEKTPSATLLKLLKNSGSTYRDFGVGLALEHRKTLSAKPVPPAFAKAQTELAKESTVEARAEEKRDEWILAGYEDLELSTQVLIRAALARGVGVEVLDRELNVVELAQGKHQAIVKQATISHRDTYLSFELMNHKLLTKKFLARAGIRVPAGNEFFSVAETLPHYEHLKNISVVVKPTTTNYGIGVSIVPKNNRAAFETAVERAFRHDESIIVEEFLPGKEYRFLVIGGTVVSVINRDPANVIGDGTRTIAELVKQKNEDPDSYKTPDKYIQTGAVEKEILARTGFTFESVPRRGQKVYLRNNSNVSDGGDPIEVSGAMPSVYKKIALSAARAVGANICGVDMIIPSLSSKTKNPSYGIIELNWNPAVYMHAYPFRGTPCDVGGAVLDFLGF